MRVCSASLNMSQSLVFALKIPTNLCHEITVYYMQFFFIQIYYQAENAFQISYCSNQVQGSFHLYFILIIIMSRHQCGYPRSSFATPPYRPLLPTGFQGYILYLHRAAVCRFELVVLLLLIHVKGSTGVHHL